MWRLSSGVEDGDHATISYLWAVVQVHRVMDDYERHFFDNRPSISSSHHQFQSNSKDDLGVTFKQSGKLEYSISVLKSRSFSHHQFQSNSKGDLDVTLKQLGKLEVCLLIS